MAEKELARHISAMANASGGVIALGIEDDGTVSGICGAKENAFRKVPIDFLQTQPQYRVEIMVTPEGERIMLFHISPSENDIIKRTNGDAFLRVGDSSRQLSSEEITALEYSKGIRSFETRIISEATVEDLDFNLIEEYRQLVEAAPTTHPLDLLRARGIIRGPDNNPRITVAAIVLFAKIPTQFLPSARVRFLRYEGNEVRTGINFNLVKDITLEQPLHRVLSEGKQLLANQMREFQQLRMPEKLTGKSRATIIKHLKNLSIENGGPVEEHSSSPRDPTKYFTVR
ncbi:MAG: putative DNA binding domain-containing protein [Oscillospiraceae bacterium]|nr:putative DNA binding domain-containing protein [Oscillospiraceae bacterium]